MRRWLPLGLVVAAASGCETISEDEYEARLAWSAPQDERPESDTADPTDDCPEGLSVWYTDADADGYGDPTTATEACEQPPGTSANYDDCDDTDADVAIPGEWYLDSDSDGVGGESVTTMCHPPTGYVAGTGDCDDTTADVFPGAPEVCDSVDNDCNELIDDDDPNLDRTELAVMYRDADGDGVGVEDDTIQACIVPEGYVSTFGDCDDTEPLATPGASEICDDGIDNDCDGTANDCELPPSIALNTDGDIRFYTDQAYVSHGERVRAVGDFSADGNTDVALSVPGEGEGTVYIMASLMAISGEAETESFAHARISGPGDDARFGHQVAGAGDVNSDGFDDLLVGDPFDDTAAADAGGSWLLLGPLSGDVDVASAGVALLGERADAKAGWSCAAAGDPNNDGVADLLVGAFTDAPTLDQAGAAYLVNGPVSGDTSLADADWVVRGGFQDRVGYDVAGDTDLNGDGVSDVVVGADRSDPSGYSNAGVVMVFYGPLSGSAVTADADALRWSATANAYTGVGLAVGGDVTGDGLDDLFIGATGENGGGTSGAGAAFVVAGPVSGATDLSGASARIDGASAGDSVGSAMAFAPDMNWDGASEVFVGARGVDQGSGGRDGGAYLWFGPVTGTLSLSSADLSLLGTDGQQVGASVDAAAEFNLDGLGDLVVGAPSGNRAFVVFGGGL